MKHVFNKNVLALLILGTAGLATGAQAAPVTQDITVTATVVGTIAFDGLQSTMALADFKDGATATQKVKFKGNTNANVSVTVNGDNLKNGRLALKQQGEGNTDTAEVDVKLGDKAIDATKGKADVANVAPGAETALTLTAVAGQKPKAGTYTGTLTVSIEPV